MKIHDKLSLKYFWEDDHLLEISISANNKLFSAKTEVYINYEDLIDFGVKLKGFPSSSNNPFSIEFGKKGGYSYFGIKIFTYDKSGHCAVFCEFEENDNNKLAESVRNESKLAFRIEPSQIDVFSEQLIKFGNKKIGYAELIGIE